MSRIVALFLTAVAVVLVGAGVAGAASGPGTAGTRPVADGFTWGVTGADHP
ncbi:hypothetical protein R8Z50_12035 [Longispora sp. K20-0274]|uniref:hypothetical protein n=1 Tax=Longispora sp. K20-0274 TaxID=3088255 RepID=UPI00399A6BAF